MERVTPQPPEIGLPGEGRPPSVLIVDDDSRVVELLQITLGGRGYRVLTAHDGEEALSAVHAHRPDFLVLDVRLPRRSGFEVCQALRQDPDFQHLPIILISGSSGTDSRLQGLRLGADDYLIKPFSPRELLLKMQRILDRHRDRQLFALKAEVLEEEIRLQRDRFKEMRGDFQAHLMRLGTILERIQDLNRHRSIGEILERFVLTAVGILDFESVALLLMRDGKLRPRVHRGLRLNEPDTLVLDPASSAAEALARSDRAIATDELALRPDCRVEAGVLSAAGILWSVGIRLGGELRGILCVGERSDREPLDRFDLRLVGALANSVGSSLANAEAFERTRASFLETIVSLLAAFESRYPWLVGHSERVRDWSLKLGAATGLDGDALDALGTAALMHNLGAVERHESLLHAAVVLTPAERMLRQREASEVADRILVSDEGSEVAAFLRHQAEYWDGSGVPDGLRGDRIPIGSRILAIANAYDALLHERPHRTAYTAAQAIELIRARAGRQFDPGLVEVFLRTAEAAEVEPSGS